MNDTKSEPTLALSAGQLSEWGLDSIQRNQSCYGKSFDPANRNCSECRLKDDCSRTAINQAKSMGLIEVVKRHIAHGHDRSGELQKALDSTMCVEGVVEWDRGHGRIVKIHDAAEGTGVTVLVPTTG